jgi:hypothetical protein
MRVVIETIRPWSNPFASKPLQKGKASDKIKDTVAMTLKLYHGMRAQ